MSPELRATLKVVIDGQAYLYAQHFKLMAEMMGREPTEQEVQGWMDEWKEQSVKLIQEILEGAEDDTN